MQTNNTHPALNFPEMEPLLSNADYIDVTSAIGKGDLRTFVVGWLNYWPAWMKPLFTLLIVLLGRGGSEKSSKRMRLTPQTVSLRAGSRVGILTVQQAEEERYWIAEMRLKSLKATLGFVVEPLANHQKRFSVLTAVHYANQSGRRSFQIIQPAHRLLDIMKTRACVRESGEASHQVSYWRVL